MKNTGHSSPGVTVGTGDTGFMKEDAPVPLGSLEVACKGWTNLPGCLEQRVWGFKSRL